MPHNQCTMLVPHQDFKAEVVALTTDPRWTDEDFVWHQDDPYADPPEEFLTVGEPMTSLATRKTHEAVTKFGAWTGDGRKVFASGVQLYGDATGTTANGQSLEVIKFTLTIFTAKARKKHYAWRSIGFMRKPSKAGKQVEENISQSGHVDAGSYLKDKEHRGKHHLQSKKSGNFFDAEFYTGRKNHRRKRRRNRNNNQMATGPPEVKTQDAHAILQCILDSVKRDNRSGRNGV